MTVRPLRNILTLQSLLAVALPFGIVALFGFFWIIPQIIKDAEDRQLRLARAVSVQVESHLETVVAIVKATASMPHLNHGYQQHLDALLGATDAMSSLYLVNSAGKVSDIALKKNEERHRVDLNNLDLSSNPLFINVSRDHKPRWSNTFLSLITGGLSVAYALPYDSGIFVGEVNLALLTKFLKIVNTDKDVMILIVDHNGQVVADNNGRYTAQQLNISNNPLVRSGITTDAPTTGPFAFGGNAMTGSMVQITDVNWHVLVARTNASIYKTSRNIVLIVLTAILIALLSGVMTSVYLARKLAARFDALAGHAQNFAEGDRSGIWPVSSIAELNQLSGNLQFMADTLHQQEIVLRESENRMASLYNITQYPFTDENTFLDHALDEVVRLTNSTIGYIYFYSEQNRQFTLNSWSHGVMRECAVQEQKIVYDLDSTGLWGEAVRQRKAIMLNDFESNHPLKKGLPEGHVPLKRFLTVPVIVEGAIVAVVGVGNKDSDYLDSDVMQLNLFMDAVWKIVNSKQADEEIRQQAQLLDVAHDSIIVRALDDRITYWNQGAVNQYGLAREDALGKVTHTLLQTRFPVALDEIVAQLHNTNLWEGELVHTTSAGAIITVASRWVLQRDFYGRPMAILEINNDITEKKRSEEERIHLEQQILHAQKLESLGVLAGGIAHDFNNILMAIIGNADLALMRINQASPAVENLRRIEQAAAQAADLAKQMLAYSGKGKFVVECLDLNQLLDEILHMLQVSISKKAVLRLNLNKTLPPVEADATQMRQIIMNLVINASEAIGDKSGVIAITTGSMDCDRSYLKDVWLDEHISEGLYVFLEIADTGCGMDKETMAKVFDPFFTTKFTGRGLGMAAVLGIVRGHKGAIKVHSEPGKGTTFKILLPASGQPANMFNKVSHTDNWQGSGTVLLVDDEETVRDIGAEMLKELGFTTITAKDGREAVEIFKTNPNIALVILDLTMPHMDGEQCFRELRQLKPDVKVIMSSGYNEQEVNQKFAGKGLTGFIQKPYRLSALKEVLRGTRLTGWIE